jgi:geranylgeranyl diphosphate synthase type II
VDPSFLKQYLGDCHSLILEQIRAMIPGGRYASVLYDLMLDYPLRAGKAFRPSLCIATCRALKGRLEDVLPTAAVLELYHNAFLIHDDVEDGSLLRRGLPTLHREYGIPVAVNVGDGMFALALTPLLDNMKLIGLGKALRILQTVARMARESVEGQALELDWIRRGEWRLRDRDYAHMCYKKTCWYTFITPILVGALVVGGDERLLSRLRRFATVVGLAFQIQDDLLNLQANQGRYGKEIGGDLWEGKRTLILIHALRTSGGREQERAIAILSKPREQKCEEDVAFLFDLIRCSGSLEYAAGVARRFALRAEVFLREVEGLTPSVHRDFLQAIADHVVNRDK